MTTKLTLTIEKDIIEKAKIYAKGTQRSLSELVQGQLENLLLRKVKEDEISPKMQSLLDKIPKNQTQYTDQELENFRREYLEKKYS